MTDHLDPLTARLLAKPVGVTMTPRQTDPQKDFTRQVEVKGNVASVEVRGPVKPEGEDVMVQGHAALLSQGLDPSQWEATGFRTSEWTMFSGEMGQSTRYTFTRKTSVSEGTPLDLTDLLSTVQAHKAVPVRPSGDHGIIIAIGDMQFGKIDGDGVAGTLARTIDYLDKAANLVATYRERFNIGHVHVSWLGDHIEGFVSQGGANVWRTPLTLNEQIRLTRRVMLHALTNVVDLAENVTMSAVPGNHGDPQRFAGKGVTRYDDSHDTESLIAVMDAAELNPRAFGHVKFFVPGTDELTVVNSIAGTTVAQTHGNAWRPNRHWEWWRGQAFDKKSAMHQADLLLAGHLHHELIDSDGKRLFIQVPSIESESTWYKNATGTGGHPGLVVAITKDGLTSPIEIVR